ncbi:MAG: ABC transporter permease [Acidobacteriota bacterium]
MAFIEKQAYMLDFTLSSLVRRKGKNVSLLVVYTFMVFLIGSVILFTDAVKREAILVLADAPEIMVQKITAGRHDLIPVSYIEAIAGIRGVRSVNARLWGYYYDATNGANYTVMANDSVCPTRGAVSIGSGVARNLPVGENGTIPFKACDGSYVFLTIKDILSPGSELVTADLVVVSEEDFRTIFGIPVGYATDLALTVGNTRELPTIAAKIAQVLPDSRPILRDEIIRTYEALFDWRGGLVVAILGGAILAFMILAWDKATGLSGEEKKEIGILKGLGWDVSDVLLMKFWEGACISLSAFLVGIVLAYAHVFLGSAVVFEPVLKGWSVLYPHFRLTPYIDGYHLACLFFLIVVPYTVATVVPSWRAATIDPDSIMRT